MRANEFILEALDWGEQQRKAMELIRLQDEIRSRSVTLEDIKLAVSIVKQIGRSHKYYPYGTAGRILDDMKVKYREEQMRSGLKPKLEISTNARDFATQIALHTGGSYNYKNPIKWSSSRGGTHYDPAYFVIYNTEEQFDSAWQWISSIGKQVHYTDSMRTLRTAIQIGKFLIEPNSVIYGAFSDSPRTVHRLSVRTTKFLKNWLNAVQDITPQQAAALKDIANTRNQNAMEKIAAIMSILQGEQDLKKIIDNSKQITPADKAKLDAIITIANAQTKKS